MEFEDMQVIWNSQNNEKLYAINEAALYEQIKRKGKSVDRLLEMSQLVMIAVNLFVGIFLIIDAWRDNGELYEYILPAMYLAYFIGAIVFRLVRRKEQVRFEETMLGELDKAIWQADYLIKQGYTLIKWYLLPLMLAASGSMLYNGKPFWALGMFVFMAGASYLSHYWEIERCYVPKKRELEGLREKLVEPES